MIRRNHKDRLFVKLFGDPDNKENLLSLYNALNDRSYDDPNELEINTIEDVIYMGRKNDVSCIIDAHMNLFEHRARTTQICRSEASSTSQNCTRST